MAVAFSNPGKRVVRHRSRAAHSLPQSGGPKGQRELGSRLIGGAFVTFLLSDDLVRTSRTNAVKRPLRSRPSETHILEITLYGKESHGKPRLPVSIDDSRCSDRP